MKYNNPPAKLLCADPPWPEKPHKPSAVSPYRLKSNAGSQYNLMTLGQIMELPIPPMQDDSYLFLWTSQRRIHDAIQVARSWGFTYSKNAIIWVKTTHKGNIVQGMGLDIAVSHELAILAKRGKPKNRYPACIKSVLIAERKGHSVKPEQFYDMMEIFTDGPYVELFARRKREGWYCYGDDPNVQ